MPDEKDTLPNAEKMFEILLSIQSDVQETKREVQNNSLRLTALETGFNIFRVETNKQLEKIDALLTSVEARLTSIEARLSNAEARLENVENYAMLIMGKAEGLEKRGDEDAEKLRLRFVSVEARMERLEAMGHSTFAVAKDVRADLMILREELFAQLAAQSGIPRTDRLSVL